MSYKALDIANKILAKSSQSDSDELISNMKLQKLLYYMQGFYLAYFDKPLFDEEIEAWMYGPVVPSVYENFKSFGNAGISYLDEVVTLEPKEESLFNEVYKVFGAYSAIGLMDRTHSEKPWKDSTIGVGSIISKDSLKSYFKTRLK
jgi:uncharacterized phage-associated protein